MLFIDVSPLRQVPVSIWKSPHGSAMRAFHSLLRATDRPGHGRADVGCGQIGLKQQHARDGRQHELLPAGAVIRQCRDAQKGRELAPENAPDLQGEEDVWFRGLQQSQWKNSTSDILLQ